MYIKIVTKTWDQIVDKHGNEITIDIVHDFYVEIKESEDDSTSDYIGYIVERNGEIFLVDGGFI